MIAVELWLSAALAVASFVGLLISAHALREALRDRAALRASGRNGGLEIVATAAVRTEQVRLALLAMCAVQGAASFADPSVAAAVAATRPLMLLLSALLLTARASCAAAERRAALDLAAHEEASR